MKTYFFPDFTETVKVDDDGCEIEFTIPEGRNFVPKKGENFTNNRIPIQTYIK